MRRKGQPLSKPKKERSLVPRWFSAIPEVFQLPPAQQEDLWNQCRQKVESRWSYLFILFGILVVPGALSALLLGFVYRAFHPLLTIPMFAITVIAFKRYNRRIYMQTIQFLLPDHCRRCGYDLKGNESGTCPECGEMTESQKEEAEHGWLNEP